MSKTTVTINRIKKMLDGISGLPYDDRLAEIEAYVKEKVDAWVDKKLNENTTKDEAKKKC